MSPSDPATKQDLQELKSELLQAMSRMEARFDRAETTLLKGFHAQMRSQEARLGRFRADILNIDQEIQVRLAAAEERITAIEERLPPP
jgi:hypothetical protein